MMNAITAAGPKDAYTAQGYQHYPLRTFLTPLEQTARLCHMQYSAPYVLYSSLEAAEDNEMAQHLKGYEKLINAICNDKFDFKKAVNSDTITAKVINDFIR